MARNSPLRTALPRLPSLPSLSSGRVQGTPLAPKAIAIDARAAQPYPDPPPGWAGPLTEWVVWWYLTDVKGWEEGYDADFLYQAAIPAPGLNTKDFNRADFWLLPGGRSGAGGGLYSRGTIINPISFFTHSIDRDRLERDILGRAGYLEIYIDEQPLLEEPRRVIELAIQGNDVSSRGAI